MKHDENEIFNALKQWFYNQEIPVPEATCAMLRLSGVIIGSIAPDEDKLEDLVNEAASVFCKAAARSFEREKEKTNGNE